MDEPAGSQNLQVVGKPARGIPNRILLQNSQPCTWRNTPDLRHGIRAGFEDRSSQSIVALRTVDKTASR